MEKGKLIGQGRTAEIFEWGEDKILKLFRSGIPQKQVRDEYKISLEISKKIKLTPKVYEFIEIDNRNGIIYERINGPAMMKIIASKPWTVKKEAQRLAELHKSIQKKIDFELPKYKVRLMEDISRVNLLSDDIKTKLYKYIEELPDGDMLCHGDLHPDNILITKDEPIIIDWMTATKGNPLADVARTSIMFKFGDIPEKSYIEKKIINFIRKKFYLEYIKRYINISKVDIEQIKRWELPVAAARLVEWIPENEKIDILNFITREIENLP
ncbi:aminoglycoside phosphotransferase family protein [Clostridium sp. UBA6640]|uniref:aminoglycoside phosphotransferase family protein n=1 Tax=Clostridium sp. UBA6640 TaxID=1946370 RepID=UPI0025C1E79E|nr:aminoglycoside phosphotransferase family protein [Clostridium sp. UBA6640]